MNTRRALSSSLALLAATACGWPAGSAIAQPVPADFPARPIRVVVPYAVGGADLYVRALQAVLDRRGGPTLVVESVVGAGGTVGAGRVRRAAPDGYTLLFTGTGALTIAPRLQGDNLSPADFAPVISLLNIPYVVALRKGSPIRNPADFIAYVKAHPGALDYGSPGIGSAPHLAMEALGTRLGASMTHIPFTGISVAVQALLGGHIDAVIGAPSNVLPQVAGGQLQAIGVTGRSRSALFPELPTFVESGANVEVTTHFGFLAPAGTPRAVIERLAALFGAAAADEAFLASMEKMQTNVEVLPAAAFSKALAAESAYFAPLVARMKP